MSPSPRRKLSPVRSIAGVKRPAASLLPAFEPLSSSPILPRALKRSRGSSQEVTYPTPVPTSSTVIPTSSPNQTKFHPSLKRASTVSERAPLADLPSIVLPRDGKVVLMGRSKASCHYQLPTNHLISRVHIAASFKTGLTSTEDKIEIVCSGWNGIKVHCRGNVVALGKGDTFCSSQQGLDIIVDVQESRIRIRWPNPDESAFNSGSSDEENSPTRHVRSLQRHSSPPSPLRARNFIVSPVSPSPAVKALNIPSSPPNPLQTSDGPVIVFEDTSASPERPKNSSMTVSQSTQRLSQSVSVPANSQDDNLDEPQSFSDRDEENDPVIHSFGPFGANLLPRMASFTTGSQTNSPQRLQPLGASVSPSQHQSRAVAFDIKTHVINQLAYSRLSSTPLSTIISHFPADAGSFSHDTVTAVISQTECVGEIAREGKDATGKPLESEYYYIPDKDEDEMRRQAIVNDLQKPGLRSCRKQHKQYFWRRPK